MRKKKVHLWLQDIRSVYNVGSIFRTADASGVDKIYLVGTTPTPIDRFGRIRRDLGKVALGAENNIPWEYYSDWKKLFLKLKKEKINVVALEQEEKSVDYKKFKIENNLCLILGEEVNGISKEILKKVDTVIEIPMRGKKESLNVSVAAGVALFRILKV
jgi:tRNA G18 (ribose-2'-O)-methylase SpoU